MGRTFKAIIMNEQFARSRSLTIVIWAVVFFGCQSREVDINEYLEGWEFFTTFKVLPSHKIVFIENHPEFSKGDNDILFVEIERNPIFKGKDRISDLRTFRFLLIELSPEDTIVTPAKLGRSRMFRQIAAMSPSRGAQFLKPDEGIEARRIALDRWSFVANLDDFKFEGVFSFADSSEIVTRHLQCIE